MLLLLMAMATAAVFAFIACDNGGGGTDPQHTYFTLTYTAGTGGTIQGNTPQQVRQGNSGTSVTAVPNSGWQFTAWSDGLTTATRQDTNVQANLSVTAQFAQESGTVTPSITSVTVSPTTATMNIGGTQQLIATVIAVGGASESVEWESSNPLTATVNANGLVTAHALGSATITVRSQFDNTKYAEAIITVSETPVTPEIVSISVSPTTATIYVNDTQQLAATVVVLGGANQNVEWQSSASLTATVDENGLVTAHAAGNVAITVTSVFDDTKYATANITINLRTPNYTAPTNLTAAFGQALSAVNLNLPVDPAGTWAWDNPTDPVGNVGNQTHYATLTPNNAVVYKSVTIPLVVNVEQANPLHPSIPGPFNVVFAQGQTLNDLTVNLNGWRWVNSSQIVGDVRVAQFEIKYGGGNFTIVNNTVQITITPAISTPPSLPEPFSVVFVQGHTLSDLTANLNGWRWTNPNEVVGDVRVAQFSIEYGGGNFTLVSNTVQVTINQSTPVYTIPTGLSATFGQTLAQVTPSLPLGWSWEYPTDLVGNAGEQTHNAIFTPADAINFYSVTRPVSINVAQATPTAPTGITAIFGQTLAQATSALPTGWSWVTPTDLVGNAGTQPHQAAYAGSLNFYSIYTDVTIAVARLQINIPSLSVSSFVFNSTLHTVALNIAGQFMLGGTTSAINAGSYTATVTLNDTANTEWQDGTSDPINLDWTITRQVITMPSLITSSFVFNNSARTVTLNASGAFTLGGQVTATNAGNYIATVTLNDPANTQWTNGTTNPLNLNWTITRQVIAIPSLAVSSFVFNNSARTVTLNASGAFTLGGQVTATNAGNYTATVTLNDPANTQWTNGTTNPLNLNWTITRQVIAIPSLSASSFVYNSTLRTVALNATGQFTLGGTTSAVNAGTYIAVVTLNNTQNTQWSDGTTGQRNLAWVINRANISPAPTNPGRIYHADPSPNPIPLSNISLPGNWQWVNPSAVLGEGTHNNIQVRYHRNNNFNDVNSTVTVIINLNAIMNATHLNAIRNNLTGNFTLGANIDLSSFNNWIPIPTFQGTLDGNGFTISNLSISTTHTTGTGLFANIGANGTVRNLNLANVNVVGGVAGSLAGISSGTITNVHVLSGTVGRATSDEVGGIVGRVTGSSRIITNSSNHARVQGNDIVGGIGGWVSTAQFVNITGTLAELTNHGEISGTGSVGGIFGRISAGGGIVNGVWAEVTFNLLINHGNVSGTANQVGGIIGRLWTNATANAVYGGNAHGRHRPFRITNSQNHGNITGANFVGGILGNGTPNQEVQVAHTLLQNVYNSGLITGVNDVGGLAGGVGTIWDSNNSGNIVGTGINAGGLAGFLRRGNPNLAGSASINTGNVQGHTRVGGLFGRVSMRDWQYHLENLTNEGTVTGHTEVGGIAGIVTAGGHMFNQNHTTANFTSLINHGVVTATGAEAGGLFGRAWTNANNWDHYGGSGHRIFTIIDSANHASVTGANWVGGFVGWSSNQIFLSGTRINSVGLAGITATETTNRHEFLGNNPHPY